MCVQHNPFSAIYVSVHRMSVDRHARVSSADMPLYIFVYIHLPMYVYLPYICPCMYIYICIYTLAHECLFTYVFVRDDSFADMPLYISVFTHGQKHGGSRSLTDFPGSCISVYIAH